MAKVCSVSSVRRRRRDSLSLAATGTGGAGAASRRAMQRPRFQVSRAVDDQIEWLAREFRKVFFPTIPAAARHHWPRPESYSNAMARHSGPARVARGSYCARHREAQRQARLIRPGPSHTQQPAVHHSRQPASLAAARITRRGPPSPAAARRHRPRAVTVVTRRGPPSLAAAASSTRPSHSQRPVSLRWRRGPPSLATARLTDSVTRRCRGAKAEVYVVVRIWNTLITILGTP